MIQISIENLIALLALIGTFAGAFGGLWWHLERRCQQLTADIAAFELRVAKNYASADALRAVEERLVNAMDRLSDEISKLRQSVIEAIKG
jgi:hypothetical protein